KIPFGSRVIAIADAYDAMTSPHSYRAPVSRESALDTLMGKGGTQFDPELARRFCELIRATAVVEEGALLPEAEPGSGRPPRPGRASSPWRRTERPFTTISSKTGQRRGSC